MNEEEEESAAVLEIKIDEKTEVKKNSSVVLSPDKYYEGLLSESPYLYGDHGIPPSETKGNLDWIDFDLIREGKEFVRSHFFAVMFAHFVSLIMIFTFKPGRAVLLSSGESHSKANSLVRYLSTVLHIKLWYESDVIERTARGSQDVYAVRKMHAAAAKNYVEMKRVAHDNGKSGESEIPELTEDKRQLLDAVRKDTAGIDESHAPTDILTGNPLVPMSQFDMVVTQFCFIGFIALLPKTFGIFNSRGMDGFMHLWAILGWNLGIEDRFNLALHYDEQRRVGKKAIIKNTLSISQDKDKECTKIDIESEFEPESNYIDLGAFSKMFYNIFLPNLKHTDETAIIMWDSLVYGSQHYTAFLRLKSVIYYMLVYVAQLGKAENLRAAFSCYDKFCYQFLLLGIQCWARHEFAVAIMNRLLRFSLWICQKRYLPQWSGQPRSSNSCPQSQPQSAKTNNILQNGRALPSRLNCMKTIKIKGQPAITQHVIHC